MEITQVPVAMVRLTSRGGDDAAHVPPGQAVEHQVGSPESRRHRGGTSRTAV
jgi:hypothetical protein